jgi:hypothetical protein
VADTTNYAVGAKGDLLAGTAADTVAALAVGNDGETLVADSSTSTGLSYQANWAAGKNKIINGDFGIWQRGTSFTSQTFGTYYSDRWVGGADGGGTRTISQQTFTPGTAPVAGYEGTFFFRAARSVAGSGSTFDVVEQRVEDVRTFAGQSITFSFWAKADAARTVSIAPEQIFGTGGSANVTGTGANFNITTSWVRYSFTTLIPSISGKTIGTGSYLNLRFVLPLNTTFTIDIWGVQLEAGSTATAFQTATGTIQGELAACQRYYFRWNADTTNAQYGNGFGISTTAAYIQFQLPIPMRVAPTALDYSGVVLGNGTTSFTGGTWAFTRNHSLSPMLQYGSTTGLTANNYYQLLATSTSHYIGFSAEL